MVRMTGVWEKILKINFRFVQSGNDSVASWMDRSDTHFILGHWRSDLLLLRITGGGWVLIIGSVSTDKRMIKEQISEVFSNWLPKSSDFTIENSVPDHKSFKFNFKIIKHLFECPSICYNILFSYFREAYCNFNAVPFCLSFPGTHNPNTLWDQIVKLFNKYFKILN